MAVTVKREDGKVWIEGVPTLGWGRHIECTYAGAVWAALSVTEHPCTYEEIMGVSGLAFRVCWWASPAEPGKRGWCPSAPVGEFPKEIEATQRRTGWRFLEDARMDRENEPHMEERVPDIRAAIDAGRPVIAYPTSQNLNVGVIYGYEAGCKAWLMRDYFAADGTTAVPAEKLGPMILIPMEHRDTMQRREAVRESLSMAVAHWRRGRGPGPEGPYLYGRAALEQWAGDIALADEPAAALTDKERGNLLFLGWWSFSQWQDAREAAAKFLRQAAAELGCRAGRRPPAGRRPV